MDQQKNGTQRLLDEAARRLGGISDYRLAKLMRVTPSAVSRWRTGVGHMANNHVVQACALASLPQLEWIARVAADRESPETGQVFRQMVADIEAAKRGKVPDPKGLFAFLTGWRPPTRNVKSKRRAASAVAMAALALGFSQLAPAPAEAAARCLYIMVNCR